LQNGVEAEAELASIIGKQHVMGGVAEMSAFIAEPGTVERVGPISVIRFGELCGGISERAQRLEEALTTAHIDCDLSSDINQAIWRKFVLLVGLSALTTLTRKPIGDVRDDPDTCALLEQVMQETFKVARAKGVNLPEDFVADRMAFIAKWPPEIRASMAVDLERGKPLELPWLSGAVVRLGKQLGVPTPANAFVVTALKLYVDGDQPI
jgi:2-dehydropantoate 2-reductase